MKPLRQFPRLPFVANNPEQAVQLSVVGNSGQRLVEIGDLDLARTILSIGRQHFQSLLGCIYEVLGTAEGRLLAQAVEPCFGFMNPQGIAFRDFSHHDFGIAFAGEPIDELGHAIGFIHHSKKAVIVAVYFDRRSRVFFIHQQNVTTMILLAIAEDTVRNKEGGWHSE